ncbi:MAG: hypothetical protein ABIO83_00415, partial [Ilumatobacteraceae bacterium]
AVRFDPVDIRILGDGSIVAAGERTTVVGDPFSNDLWAAKVTDAGQPAPGFGTNGVAIEFEGFTVYRGVGEFAPDGSIVIAQTASGSGNVYTPLSAAGVFGALGGLTIDAGSLPPGCPVMGTQLIPFGSVTVSSDQFVHAATFGCPSGDIVLVTRQSTSGSVAWTKVILPPQAAPDDAQSRATEIVGSDVVVATGDGTATTLHRFALADGAPSASWGTSGRVALDPTFGEVGGITDLGAGNIAVVNAPLFVSSPTDLRVVRLLATGASDTTFTPVNVPVGGGLVSTAVAGTPSGNIVVSVQTDTARTLRRFVSSSSPVPAAVPLTPARLLETRPGEITADGQFQGGGRLAAGSVTKVRIAGRQGIPADATAAIVNLTVVSPSAPGFATLYPCTPTVPNSSSINYGPGDFVANGVTTKLDANGDVCIFTLAATDILIDANGYIGR